MMGQGPWALRSNEASQHDDLPMNATSSYTIHLQMSQPLEPWTEEHAPPERERCQLQNVEAPARGPAGVPARELG
jgi:hypothetical protein